MTRSEQFFHGTTHNITDGVVRPADLADKNVSEFSMGDPGNMSEGDHAFVSEDEHHAWRAATTFHKNGRRPRVYETGPADDMKPGPWNKDHPDFLAHHDLEPDPNYPTHPDDIADAVAQHLPEWGSKTGFPVRKRIDIMPGHQGTFPSENWNKYKMHGPRAGLDANHPDDSSVKYGMNRQQSGVEASQEHAAMINEGQFGHDWHKDPAPHSILREEAGRPQKRWATLFD